MKRTERPFRVFVQADLSSAHMRRVLEGVADHASACAPRWRLQWGWKLPAEAELKRGGFDGLVRFEEGERGAGRGLPTVWVCGTGRVEGEAQIVPRNREAGLAAAAHFRERCHRHFAFVGWPGFLYARERLEGFREGLGGAEIAVHGEPWRLKMDAAAEKKLIAFLRGLPARTAVLAASDMTALHVTEACERAGLRVPEDLALLGVDNDVLLAHASPVTFSSVALGSEDIGRRAAMRLEAMMRGRRDAGRLEYAGRISVVARASTDLLATDDAKVAEAVRAMRAEACAGIGVAEVCRRVGMGRRSFELRFAKVLGCAPAAELRRVRMERAEQLLATTQHPVARVAEEAGFGDAFYFSAAFRKAKGMSPQAWRRAEMRAKAGG